MDGESALGGVSFLGIWLMVVGGRRLSRESKTRIALSEKQATGSSEKSEDYIMSQVGP